jgi:acyl-coenzyme A synthetase/AMP-(fatty) acid ligase
MQPWVKDMASQTFDNRISSLSPYLEPSWIGMTETSTAVSMTSALEKVGKAGSAGVALPGVRFKVVKEDGSLAKLGERGELIVKSPSNSFRYWENAKASVPPLYIFHDVV